MSDLHYYYHTQEGWLTKRKDWPGHAIVMWVPGGLNSLQWLWRTVEGDVGLTVSLDDAKAAAEEALRKRRGDT